MCRTENIESVWHLQGGHKLDELSVEQIVDCDDSDDGFNGGDLPTAYAYVLQAGGKFLTVPHFLTHRSTHNTTSL